MGLNSILNTSVTGLTAARVGLSVTSHNISNANVVGYSRQRASFTTLPPNKFSDAGFIGNGVNVEKIDRIRDIYLDQEIHGETATSEENIAKSEIITNIEMYLNEPGDSALNKMMIDMWNGWNDVAADPQNTTKQQIVIEDSKEFLSFSKSLTARLENLQTNITDITQNHETELSKLTDDLDKLNTDIQKANQYGGKPNDLLDERDRILNDMSKYTDISVTYNADYTVDVSAETTGGPIPITGPTKVAINTISSTFTSGSIKGYNDMQATISNELTDLNTLVEGIVSEINTIHNEAGGGNFFNYTPGDALRTAVVNPLVDNGTVRVNVGDPLIAGDGNRATRISALQDSNIIGGKTPPNFYNAFVQSIGTAKNQADRNVGIQHNLLTQLTNLRESKSGVSLDEETMNLVKYQTAYDANAKVVQIATDMLDTVIGLIR